MLKIECAHWIDLPLRHRRRRACVLRAVCFSGSCSGKEDGQTDRNWVCEEPAVPLDPQPPSLFSFPAIVGLHQQHPAGHQAVGGDFLGLAFDRWQERPSVRAQRPSPLSVSQAPWGTEIYRGPDPPLNAKRRKIDAGPQCSHTNGLEKYRKARVEGTVPKMEGNVYEFIPNKIKKTFFFLLLACRSVCARRLFDASRWMWVSVWNRLDALFTIIIQ